MKDTMKLKNVLTFHLAKGNIMPADLAKHECLQALQGGELRINAKTRHLHRNLKVNGANTIKPDIVCDNGVCHTSDKGLMPRWQRWQNKKCS